VKFYSSSSGNIEVLFYVFVIENYQRSQKRTSNLLVLFNVNSNTIS